MTGTSSTSAYVLIATEQGALDCGPGFNFTGELIDVASLDFTAPALTVTVTIDNASVRQGVSVCYEDPTPFKDFTGTTVTTGLLPTCATTSNAPPCLVGATQIQRNVAVNLLIPPGDPKIHTVLKKHPKIH